MDTKVADALIGALVDGRYRVRARVARGGMATVYTALDERLERTVALKIIHPAQAQDAQFLERFTDEAKTIARLTHPNVVAVYDQGTHQGLPYLVMEYVRGRTLREVLAERRRLKPQEALAVMEQMLAAIAAAHRNGLVHRDVKPENVLVAEAPGHTVNSLIDGVVKVADFGLARAVERSADEAGGGHLLATAAYVAPELVTSGHADPRTDVYSAGIVLFEMLTGRVPYDGDRPADVAWQHVHHDIPPPSRYAPDVPPVLDELTLRATRREAGARPTDAGAMLAEVQSAREDVGLTLAQRAAPLTEATAVIPRIGGERPSWSRLPQKAQRPQPHRRRAVADDDDDDDGPGFVATFMARVNGHPQGRLALAAALVTLGLVAAVGGWWFGIGRYTTAPSLLDKPIAAATEEAKLFGFKVKLAPAEYSAKNKDTIIKQDPAPDGRIVNGGTITLTPSKGQRSVEIPDVVGREFGPMAEQLAAAGLVVERTPDEFDDSIPAGYVTKTDPPHGGTVAFGSKIRVTVSKGRAEITVPSVINMPFDQASAQLTRLGLVVVRGGEEESDKPKDTVLRQSLDSGKGVERGTQISLVVSKGPTETQVPNLRNMSCAEARAALTALGLNMEIAFGREEGRVLNQDPNPGQKVPPGTTVRVFCGVF